MNWFRALILSSFLPLSLPAAFAQQTPTLLHGAVVAPDKAIMDGWIEIQDGKIVLVSDQKPNVPGALVVETGGTIYPGFVDLHNHPTYSVFPRWEPNSLFVDRYVWRGLPGYGQRVGTPGRLLQEDDQAFCDLSEFGDIRALVAGTTSIHGTSAQKKNTVPDCILGLVRHLDWKSDSTSGGRVSSGTVVGAIDVDPITPTRAKEIRKQIADGEIKLFLIHLAEGAPNDDKSIKEFSTLKGLGLLTKNTAIIHGAALHAAEFDQMQKAGTALIWSPKSNIVLYGTTTDVASAMRSQVTVALAPDWSITGSTNMLGEISYAHAYLKNTNQPVFTDKQLFEMATSAPARLAGLENEIGTLKVNSRADLFILRSAPKQPDDVYTALTQANPQDVVLVLVGGNPVYGLDRLVAPIINTSLAPVSVEPLNVCGEVRAFVTTKDSRLIDTWANLRSRLQVRLAAYDLQLAPLFECP